MKKTLLLLVLLIAGWTASFCQETEYRTEKNLQYYDQEFNQSDSLINNRCVLDVYYPVQEEKFSTVVWFHGGGLTQGQKEIPESLKNKNICVVGVNYRLYPNVKSPAYIEDAAAAVAWAIKNIQHYGGDSSLVFVSGHSAGGYLAAMVGLDQRWLEQFGVDANQIAGIIPFSGHAITHFTIREERGIEGTQPIIDDLAPLFHVRSDAPPMLLITGDRNLELLGRYEENAYLMRMMRVVGHQDTRLLELDGYDHGMTEPAFPLLLKEVERVSVKKQID
jgi:acetyl esterase/lipase